MGDMLIRFNFRDNNPMTHTSSTSVSGGLFLPFFLMFIHRYTAWT